MDKKYLGDGLYAEHDGFGIWVRSENGIAVLHQVYFEPAQLTELIKYAQETTGVTIPGLGHRP